MSDSTASKTPKAPVVDDQDPTVGTDPRPAPSEPKNAPAKTAQPAAETKPKT